MAGKATYVINEDYFHVIDSADKAYWLGFLSADGHVEQVKPGKLRLLVQLGLKDKCLLERFVHDINSNHPITNRLGGFGTPMVSLAVTRYRFVEPLKRYNFKTESIFSAIPSALHCHLIRGIFDGDGTVWKDVGKERHTGYVPETYRIEIVNQSQTFLEVLQKNLMTNCAIGLTKITAHNNAWYLKISGTQQVLRVKHYLYPPGNYPYLRRKYEAMPS